MKIRLDIEDDEIEVLLKLWQGNVTCHREEKMTYIEKGASAKIGFAGWNFNLLATRSFIERLKNSLHHY